MQHNDRVQLQHPTLQRQGEAGSRYNILLGPPPYPTVAQGNKMYYRVKFIGTIIFTTLTHVYRGKANVINRFIWIHYYTCLLPSFSCQEDKKVMPTETSKKPCNQDHSRTSNAQKAENLSGDPAWDHRAFANYLLMLPRKDSSECNGTKTEPHPAGVLLGSSHQSS